MKLNLNLIESKKDRESVMNGNLGNDRQIKSLLSGLVKAEKMYDYWTEPMVANFYRVGDNAIKSLASREPNKEELKKYGYKVYSKGEILKLQVETLEKAPNRGLRLYPLKAVFLIGMMLTESEVAERLRKEIIDVVFNGKVDLLEARQDKLEVAQRQLGEKVHIKKKDSIDITKLIKGKLKIDKISEAPYEYNAIREWIFIDFNVSKFEDIPVSKYSLMKIVESIDEASNHLDKGDKQISFLE